MAHKPLVDPADTRRLKALFFSAFSVMDIARALPSFDKERGAAEVGETMRREHLSVVGVRDEGVVVGFAETPALAVGTLADHMKPFDSSMVLTRTASLADVVTALDRHSQAFISMLGEIGAVVTPADLQKPPMRMWLFGMITILEMNVTRAIRALWSEEEWRRRVSAGRTRKAEELQKERERRGQECDLLDCLQLSDKAYVLLKDAEVRAKLGFQSMRTADGFIKALESLRNNLAHSQDILSRDWQAIVGLTADVEGLLEARGLSRVLAGEVDRAGDVEPDGRAASSASGPAPTSDLPG